MLPCVVVANVIETLSLVVAPPKPFVCCDSSGMLPFTLDPENVIVHTYPSSTPSSNAEWEDTGEEPV